MVSLSGVGLYLTLSITAPAMYKSLLNDQPINVGWLETDANRWKSSSHYVNSPVSEGGGVGY